MIKNRLHTLSLYVGLLCLILLGACQDSLFYTHYQDIPEQKWDSQDTLFFSIPPSDTDLDVAVTLGVRTHASCSYKDIVARAQLLDGDSVVSSIPLNITLYNNDEPAHGLRVCDHFSRPQPLRMKAHHDYTLRVTHLMRLNPLDDIVSVGITVER